MPSDLATILQLSVPIIVRIGSRTMPLSDVVALVPGSIIEIPKSSESDLDLLVNNRQIGLGSAAKVGENFGLRITYIGDVRSRIEALGAGPVDHTPPIVEDLLADAEAAAAEAAALAAEAEATASPDSGDSEDSDDVAHDEAA